MSQAIYLPYRNIRDVLALHTKVARQKICLVYYDAHKDRHELSYDEFVARAHQIANMMYEDLGVVRGDRVAVLLNNSPETLLVYCASWIIGAAVVPLDASWHDDDITRILHNTQPRLWFVDSSAIERGASLHTETGTDALIIAVGEAVTSSYIHLQTAARNRSTTFLGDDSGAKAGDVPIAAANERTASRDDTALIVHAGDEQTRITQGQLLQSAHRFNVYHAITANQKVLLTQAMHHLPELLVGVLSPLVAGGTLVLNTTFEAHTFWERVVRERVHIASVTPDVLQALLTYSAERIQQGETPYGHRIHRLNLTRFRHFICHGRGLTSKLAGAVSEQYGFALLNSYTLPGTLEMLCALPVDLPWETLQSLLTESAVPSIGCALQPGRVQVLNAAGNPCAGGETGLIALMHDGSWSSTGDQGFYQDGMDGRRFFFITGEA